jgi:hypothetical protein
MRTDGEAVTTPSSLPQIFLEMVNFRVVPKALVGTLDRTLQMVIIAETAKRIESSLAAPNGPICRQSLS